MWSFPRLLLGTKTAIMTLNSQDVFFVHLHRKILQGGADCTKEPCSGVTSCSVPASTFELSLFLQILCIY